MDLKNYRILDSELEILDPHNNVSCGFSSSRPSCRMVIEVGDVVSVDKKTYKNDSFCAKDRFYIKVESINDNMVYGQAVYCDGEGEKVAFHSKYVKSCSKQDRRGDALGS